ncbi:hypothetical protein ACHAWU_005194 [Discostella pseudostelligera]|uniref:Uncharacterized protein n=1 Tax=Discostella pseudostelligera TaxID=259834 RepID=A0ABD3MBU6_9STRA
MLLEVINSVFLTYIATEYLLVENDDLSSSKTSRNNIKSFQQLCAALFTSQQSSRPRQYIFLIVLSTNILVRFHATGVALAEWIHNTVGRTQHHFHVPRILVAICSFLIALYWDCRQKYKHLHSKHHSCSSSGVAASSPPWSNQCFLQQLLQSFCIKYAHLLRNLVRVSFSVDIPFNSLLQSRHQLLNSIVKWIWSKTADASILGCKEDSGAKKW